MNLGLGINIGGRAVGGFSPALLFAASEPGVWYDPSDFSTMFQESTGVTPVTAVGQSVGFLGDKSRGFALGSELVSNGTFDSGTTGWSRGFNSVDGTFTASAGVATYTVGAGDGVFPRMVTAISGLTVGRFYRIRFDEVSATGAGDRLVVWTSTADGTGGTSINQVTAPNWSAESKSYFYPATATTMYLAVSFASTSAGATLAIDNVSVRELPGNHATQSTAASRPTLGRVPVGGRRNLLTFTSAVGSTNWTSTHPPTLDAALAPDGTMTMTRANPASTASQIFQSATLALNTAYRLSIYAQAGTSARSRLSLFDNTGADFQGELNITWTAGVPSQFSVGGSATGATFESVGGGIYRISVTVTSDAVNTSHRFQWYSDVVAGTGTTFIWGAQLETGSTATAYQRVVTAFDVTEAGVADCYYLSFDGSDDFLVTGTITPGIDKAQVFAGVRKLSDVGLQSVVGLSTAPGTSNGTFEQYFNFNGAGNNLFLSRGTSNGSANGSAGTAPNDLILSGLMDIAGDSVVNRVNAVQVATSAADQGTGNYLAYPIYIGRRAGTTLPFNGQLFSLVTRFGANLTADQITQAERFVAGKTGITI